MKLDIQLFAVPFRRVSKSRKRMRNAHKALEPANLVKCPNCNEAIKPHRACTNCGYYKGKKANHKVKEAA